VDEVLSDEMVAAAAKALHREFHVGGECPSGWDDKAFVDQAVAALTASRPLDLLVADNERMHKLYRSMRSKLTTAEAELERLRAVAEAAVEFVHKTDSADSLGWIRFDARLRRAVDLYDRAALTATAEQGSLKQSSFQSATATAKETQ
jgi:hypothetical protein